MATKILISPLNWGLGHATRIVPIIQYLQKSDFDIIIAAYGKSEALLQAYFPEIRFISFPSFNIKYTKSSFQIGRVLLSIPRFWYYYFQERRKLKNLIKKEGINIVISDNKYGLWNANVYSILITHQLMLKMPAGFQFLEKIVHNKLTSYCNNFNECWIPDFPSKTNLSGDLSHKYPIGKNTNFIGPLSRFPKCAPKKAFTNELLIIISGPERQRTKFENRIINQLQKLPGYKKILVRGLPGSNQILDLKNLNCTVYNHLPTKELEKIILESKYIICRSGYSSIMDLVTLNRTALLVPTPGQTEQEYLALWHKSHSNFTVIEQEKLNLINDLKTLDKTIGTQFNYEDLSFEESIMQSINKAKE